MYKTLCCWVTFKITKKFFALEKPIGSTDTAPPGKLRGALLAWQISESGQSQ